jgi:Icc-related predicted phosphoesterase
MTAPMKRDGNTRVFYTGDIHGSETIYRKALNAGAFYRAGVLIFGGDLSGKAIVILTEMPGGKYACDFMGRHYELTTETEVQGIEQLVNLNGFYSCRMGRDELLSLGHDEARKEALFRKVVFERTARWMQLAEDKLSGKGIRCFIMLGNDDPPEIAELIGACPVLENPESRCVQLDDSHEMISLGFSNPTPWHTARELDEPQLAERIAALMADVQDASNCVFNLHAPPYGSGLDSAPLLDEELKLKRALGGAEVGAVGSTAVRGAIERWQPLLGLHGHIHESGGMTKIGRTLCINPGSAYSEGFLCGALVVLNAKGVVTHQMTRG